MSSTKLRGKKVGRSLFYTYPDDCVTLPNGPAVTGDVPTDKGHLPTPAVPTAPGTQTHPPTQALPPTQATPTDPTHPHPRAQTLSHRNKPELNKKKTKATVDHSEEKVKKHETTKIKKKKDRLLEGLDLEMSGEKDVVGKQKRHKSVIGSVLGMFEPSKYGPHSRPRAKTEEVPRPSIKPPLNQRREVLMVRKQPDKYGFVLQKFGVERAVDTVVYSTCVFRVHSDTPAFNAGLQPGDVIAEVNGESVRGLDLHEIVQNIYTSGDTVRLTVVFIDAICYLKYRLRYDKAKKKLAEKESHLRELVTKEKILVNVARYRSVKQKQQRTDNTSNCTDCLQQQPVADCETIEETLSLSSEASHSDIDMRTELSGLSAEHCASNHSSLHSLDNDITDNVDTSSSVLSYSDFSSSVTQMSSSFRSSYSRIVSMNSLSTYQTTLTSSEKLYRNGMVQLEHRRSLRSHRTPRGTMDSIGRSESSVGGGVGGLDSTFSTCSCGSEVDDLSDTVFTSNNTVRGGVMGSGVHRCRRLRRSLSLDEINEDYDLPRRAERIVSFWRMSKIGAGKETLV